MPELLFIQSSPYDQSIGAVSPPLPPTVSVVNAPPHVTVAEAQGQSVIGETHTHITSGGAIDVQDGDRLLISTSVVGPLGNVEETMSGVVVGGQVQIVDDPNRALAEALFSIGALYFDAEGNVVARVDFLQPQDTPPPAPDTGDSGGVISDTPIWTAPPDEGTAPAEGCETWQDVFFDEATQELVPALYHSTGPGTYEVFY